MDKEEVLKKAYAQLSSLRNNHPALNPHNTVDWPSVELYNKQLDKLESAGYNIGDFRIPANLLQNEWIEANYITHEKVDTGNPKVREGYFLTQLDSILTYFALGETKIGFQAT